jgi:LPXTG-motif cell wall-anchored protein
VQQGFQSHTQIHRALNCTNLNNGQDADCLFASKISDLLDVSVTAKPELGDHDVSKYVFWRYKVGNGAWKLMNDATAEEFAGAETKIFVEAWTQCGVARKFLFSVNLHAHTAVTVCDEFKNMWYQSSVSRLPIDSHVCTYEKSDFAELTFDYHPNIGLRYSRDRLSLNVSQVVCKIKLEGHSSAQLLNVTQKSPEIVSRFAIEALNNDVTAETTAFNISCSFTYSRYDATTLTKTCKKRFEIQDCTKPEIDNPKPPQGECAFDECAGNGLPGPFEACGGTIVKSSPAYEADGKTVKAKTSVVTGNKACCNMCESYQLSCNALLNLPDESEDIMRCEPVSHEGGGVYGDNTYGDNTYGDNSYSNSYTTALMSAGHALLNAGKQNTGAAALLGASALVALVALVAVKRRRSAAATKLDMVEDDAYYPLLS